MIYKSQKHFKDTLNRHRTLNYISTMIPILLFVSNIVFIPSYSEKNDQNFSMGKIEWTEKCQPLIFNSGSIRVVDSDGNLNLNAPDKLEVKIWSYVPGRDDHSSKIISYQAIETGDSTGIFDSTVFWGNPQETLGNRIPIWDGSIVTAMYVDDTLPQADSKANITSSLPVKEVKPIYKKLQNGTSIPYYVYGPCTIQFLDTTKYQFAQKIEFIFPPPSKQLDGGVPIEQIKCKEGLALLLHPITETPACVTAATQQKLAQRGWYYPVPSGWPTGSQNAFLEGFRDSYKTNESISFTLVIKSGQKCGSTEISIVDVSTFEYVTGAGIDYLCNAKYLTGDSRINIPYQGQDMPFKIVKAGSYKIVVKLEGKSVLEKEFVVKENAK